MATKKKETRDETPTKAIVKQGSFEIDGKIYVEGDPVAVPAFWLVAYKKRIVKQDD